jgi:hypothetical protein
MTDSMRLVWHVPPSVLAKGIGEYPKRMLDAVFALAQYFAARIEAFAKQNAPWSDQTGNARQGLTARAFREATAVTIVLFHTMAYGIWLEVKNSGRYAVILKTLEESYQPYMAAIGRLLR